MINEQSLSDALESLSDEGLARRRGQHVRPLKGLRGTPPGEVARLAAETWKEGVSLFEDSQALHNLFCTAHEDGLVAIGLAAAAAPDEPEEALTLVMRWLDMVDDLETADALGWVLYGPALMASGRPLAAALTAHAGESPVRRRVALMAVMAALPVPLEGPAAAPLRERVGEKRVVITGEPMSLAVSAVCHAFRADPDPHVRKALARVLRSWGESDPEATGAWLEAVKSRGGIQKFVREEAERGIQKGRRRLRALDSEERGEP